MKILILLSLIVLLASPMKASAGEGNLEPKSMGLVTVLALDPLPGDALFYAGRPVQGSINSIIGGGGIFMLSVGLYSMATCKEGPDSYCMGGVLIFPGLMFYIPALIWDGIGGLDGVRKHNAKIEQRKTSFLNTFQPTLAVTDKSAFIGAQFKF